MNTDDTPESTLAAERPHPVALAMKLPKEEEDGEKERFSVIDGPLLQTPVFTLLQGPSTPDAEGGSLRLLREGREGLQLSARVTPKGKRTRYLVLSTGPLKEDVELREYLSSLLPLDQKQVPVHQLVAALSRGADLSGRWGRLQVHHLDLNGGNNAAGNLVVVSAELHDRIHRFLDAEEEAGRLDAYLASLAGCPDGLGLLPEEIKAAITAERALFELGAQTGYDPRGQTLGAVDLSLSFLGNRMVVSGTLPVTEVVRDKDGNEKQDRWGRAASMLLWAPHTLADDGAWIEPGQPLPAELALHKPFHIDGIQGRPRWSREGMGAFQRREAPPPDLFERLKAAFDRVVGFSREEELLLVVAYVGLTYVFPLAPRCPFLALHSALPGAGKSRLLEALSLAAFNAHKLNGFTEAVVPRLADLARCTLLLDEAESLASSRQGERLIELLNSRSDAGSNFLLSERQGDDWTPRSLQLFGPTVIANLAGLAPTLQSRALRIEMRPLLEAELSKQAVSVPEAADWGALRDGLYLWAARNWRSIQRYYAFSPAVRVGGNRQADLWRLLLAVALHLGGREAFEALSGMAQEVARKGSGDDKADAMAFALWQFCGESLMRGKQPRIAQAELLLRAYAALEEDQRKFLSSRRLGDFCRTLGLSIERTGRDGNQEVWIPNAANLQDELVRRFPHLPFITP